MRGGIKIIALSVCPASFILTLDIHLFSQKQAFSDTVFFILLKQNIYLKSC
jgi:hypothetical protein